MGGGTVIDHIEPILLTQIRCLRPLVVCQLDVPYSSAALHLDAPLFITRAVGQQVEAWMSVKSSLPGELRC